VGKKQAKRGRPAVADSERRERNALPVRWSAVEVAAIEQAANRAGVPASKLIRAGALALAKQSVKAIREAIGE